MLTRSRRRGRGEASKLWTPVPGIRATSEHLLRADPERLERERPLLTLVREADRAGRLVEDLLLMAQIDRGLDLRRAPVSTTALVAQTIAPRAVTHPDRERIFERLTRLDEARVRRSAGAGLGLPIARGLARAHGGDLTAHAAYAGTGARFRLSLPG